MCESFICLVFDKLIVLSDFLLCFHLFFLLLHEGSHALVCILEEVLADDIGAESRLLHHVRWRLKHYTAISIIVLLLLGD